MKRRRKSNSTARPIRKGPRARRKNAGFGDLFEFHGSYNKKSDAVVKEAATAGSFIKFTPANGGKFLVLTRRKKNIEFGEFEKGVFHPWTMRPITSQKPAKLGKRKSPSRRPFKTSRKTNGLFGKALRAAGKLGMKGAKATLRAMKQDARVGRAKISNDDPTPGSKAWYEKTRKQLPTKRAAGAKHPMTKSEFDVFYENARGRGWNPRKKNANSARKHCEMCGSTNAVKPGTGIRGQQLNMCRLCRAGVKAYLADKGVKKNPAGSKRKRNGSLQDAAKLYEDFHGKTATKITEYLGAIVGENNFAQLGQLVKLIIDSQYEIEFPERGRDKVILASNPKGDQLYIIGGDQNVDSLLKPGEAKSDKLVDLGELTNIEYFTRKKFDSFQPVTYVHELGEETGVRPRLKYDPINKQLHIAGGAYKVKPEGIVN
ncbi:MAG: hypothetical protein JWO13_825 [Acidobacteriales bacterium]|nr:hypothetical protein [Terriglobales bacterium]